jgi:hypothetical protein
MYITQFTPSLLAAEPQNEKPVICLWSFVGCGKTRQAALLLPDRFGI